MRKIYLLIALFIGQVAHAQWTTLSSGTTLDLSDVDFLDENYGVAVGKAGTVLLTVDGGLIWTDIYNQNNDIYAVEVVNFDTIFISSYDQSNASGEVYVTFNAGTTWTPVANDAGTSHRLDLEMPSSLFTVGGNLVSTNDLGVSWDTLVSYTAGTTSIYNIKFSGQQVGQASGLISGIVTYSAYFHRTEDGGLHWYACDPFSFPNADAYTALAFVDPDTAYMFTNHYSGWSPSSQNGLVKLTNFNLLSSGFDSSWAFSSQVVNAAMPSYINDAYFENINDGVAAAENGNVYRTVNGGTAWNVDYAAGAALKKITFVNDIGYAVGNSGKIIKYDSTATAINGIENNMSFLLYPDPAENILYVKSMHPQSAMQTGKIYDVKGKLVMEFQFAGNSQVNVSSYDAGIYFLEISSDEGAERLKWIKK